MATGQPASPLRLVLGDNGFGRDISGIGIGRQLSIVPCRQQYYEKRIHSPQLSCRALVLYGQFTRPSLSHSIPCFVISPTLFNSSKELKIN